jgi:uncharacterized protein
MSRQAECGLPQVVDGLSFALEGAVVAGVVPVMALPRLLDGLANNDGRLSCRIVGNRDTEGKSWLTLDISGTLDLVCQRCLKVLPFQVDIQSHLLLVPQGQAWPDEELAEDGFDVIAAEKEMALRSLIEDEVLLALPIVPRHDVCETASPIVEMQEPSPFAVLAKLKKGV